MPTYVRLAPMILLVGACSGPSDVDAVFAGQTGSWIDLTHPFSSASIYWPTAAGFTMEEVAYGPTDGGYFYASNNFAAAEHGGTHLDAPIHFAEGRQTSDQIPLDQLIGPAIVVDVSDRVSPDYLIGVDDLEEWEAQHGPIPDGAILLLRTGWDRFYGDRTQYLGTDATGPDAVPLLHFPGLDPDAARWLVAERRIDAIGIDTPSIDYGQSTSFASHVALYEANIPGFENVTGLEQLPATGAFVIALPMKIAGGSGGPLRIVAFVPTP